MKICSNSDNSGFSLLEVMVAMSIILIIIGVALTTVNRMMTYTGTADKNMLVAVENQRGSREMKDDLYCSSKNAINENMPEVVGDELRFRVCTGFNADMDGAGVPVFPGWQVCYWLDTANKRLVRRFRDANENIMTSPPAEYPFGGATQPVCEYCTGVSFSVNADCGMVTVTLTNSIGDASDPDSDFATFTSEFTVIPLNDY